MEMFFLEEQQMQAKIAAKKYQREQADKKGERGVVGGKGKEKMQAVSKLLSLSFSRRKSLQPVLFEI